jgi:uncharacterized protein
MIPRIIALPKSQSYFLFGPRQTGKSSLTSLVYTESSWKVDLLLTDQFLEYEKAPALFRKRAEEHIQTGAVRSIVVDEVQRVPLLLSEVHHLIEKYPGVQFVLTGSSARKLRRGGVDLLGGRALELRLFPLTRRELAGTFDLEDALTYGTLPSVVGLSADEKRSKLAAYVQTYLREEIKNEGVVRNLGGFSRFLDVAGSQCGEDVNYAGIARECGLTNKTVESYYEIVEDTLIALRLEPWRKSLRKRLSGHPRFYLFDTGVTNAVNRRLGAGPDPALRGRLFEQLIVLEVQRLLSYKNSEARMFYWRTSAGAEVDLIIEKYGRIVAACEIKSNQRVDGADCTGLRAFQEEHDGVPLYVAAITSDAYRLGPVLVLPWMEFLDRVEELA